MCHWYLASWCFLTTPLSMEVARCHPGCQSQLERRAHLLRAELVHPLFVCGRCSIFAFGW
jgi:hypothetical protein